jgi:mRNA interferase MazF
MGMVTVKRFEFWLVGLYPTQGSEISKSRPCLVVSPDEVNKYLNTVTVVPLTSTLKNYPTRFECLFEGRTGQLAIDQIRSVDKTRLIRKLGILDEETSKLLCSVLVETFKY